MAISSTLQGDVQIVTVTCDRIDAAIAIQFKEQMRAETEGGPPRVILDLAKVDFIDSSGLGAIVAAMKQLEPGRRMDLANLSPMVEKVFRLTRMDTIFAIYPDVPTALARRAG